MDNAVQGVAEDRGWHKLVAFMFSGAPVSFVLWALAAYALWSVLARRGDGRDGGGSGGWFDNDGCDGGDGGGD